MSEELEHTVDSVITTLTFSPDSFDQDDHKSRRRSQKSIFFAPSSSSERPHIVSAHQAPSAGDVGGDESDSSWCTDGVEQFLRGDWRIHISHKQFH